MSACEKCWTDSRFGADYTRLLSERKDHPCTPEQQAGPDAGECPVCHRMTAHQHTGELMCGCEMSAGAHKLSCSRAARLTKERCHHVENQILNLVDRFQNWRGYDCPYCEIERLQAAINGALEWCYKENVYGHVRNALEVVGTSDEPSAPQPHRNGRCKCQYCGEGFVVWGDTSVHERSCSKNPANAEKSSPDQLVGALQDVVHQDSGPVRVGRAVKSGTSLTITRDVTTVSPNFKVTAAVSEPASASIEDTEDSWKAAYQRTISGPDGLLAKLAGERSRRIAAERQLNLATDEVVKLRGAAKSNSAPSAAGTESTEASVKLTAEASGPATVGAVPDAHTWNQANVGWQCECGARNLVLNLPCKCGRSRPVKSAACVCGDPSLPGTHRTDGPCHQ
jgi:hypothetical protein